MSGINVKECFKYRLANFKVLFVVSIASYPTEEIRHKIKIT